MLLLYNIYIYIYRLLNNNDLKELPSEIYSLSNLELL